MWDRVRALYHRLGRLDKAFLVLLALATVLRFAAPNNILFTVLAFAAFVAGAMVFFRLSYAGVKRVIWRLRYRLLVAYLFIAVVPIVLIVVLVGVGAYVFTGQIAAYLVTAELERRTRGLEDPARGLVSASPQVRLQHARWIAPFLRERIPGFEMVLSGDASFRYPPSSALQPPPGWGNASGLVEKGGAVYLWAHQKSAGAEVTMVAPVTGDSLSELVPNLGELSLLRPRRETVAGAQGEPPRTRIVIPRSDLPRRSRDRVPAPVNRFDAEVFNGTPVSVAIWEQPGRFEIVTLRLITRYSAVLRTVFAQRAEWVEGLTGASMAILILEVVAVLLLIVELASIYLGVKLTRTITYAVHNLYEGTQRVRVGDFSHRIEVRGTDQLAELGESFNRMTENLERLVEVAKEKERLQSEIEIAREVQNQLFPRTVPAARTLEFAAVCKPARLVSGDYYDYLNLHESKIAFAIGDVAGKGISAALLMATVQSSMRAQLRAGRELAAAAGNGHQNAGVSTASLVTRLNQQLYAFTPPEKFATFYFAIYDDATGLLTYTNAGHLPPIVVRKGVPLRLDVNGTVIGAFSFAQYNESQIQLEPGDLMVCFTDGITEPENDFGEMFGEDRLAEVLVKNAGRSSEEIIASVLESVQVWTGSTPELQDDMTLLVARRT